jgi:ankyrin repeat protein
LYYISTGNYEEFSKLITESNVNNIIDEKNGYTALHYAVRLNNDKMMEFLLNMGANPYLKTSVNEDTFDLSLKYQTKYVITYQLNDLTETNKELHKTISSINKKINDMNVNNKYLVKSVDDLVTKNNLLKTMSCTMKKEQTELKNKNNILTIEKNSLIFSKSSCELKNNNLKKDIELLQDNIVSLKKDNECITTDFKSLKRKYDSLDQSYSGLLTKMRK